MKKNSILTKKSLGILVHPTSLPGGTYCGTFGEGLKDWINILSVNKIYAWQFLPLTPTDSKGSPYSSPSSFAINPWFLDASELISKGFIENSIIVENIRSNGLNIESLKFKIADELSALLGELLLKAWESQSSNKKKDFYTWVENNKWVEDYSIFMVIKEEFKLLPWWDWPAEYKDRDNFEIDIFEKRNSKKLLIKKLVQWHLHRQWIEIKRYAKTKGVILIGDIPFYVSRDSVDVWRNKSLFSITNNGDLIYQSGVPPDYFSATGQLWGTPVYNWSEHLKTKFEWWQERFKRQYELVDILRLDHFRALASFWSVNGKEKDAINGKWINSPGIELLDSLKSSLNLKSLPIIAEDLGIITDDVNNLRDKFNLPGMKILQFAFDGIEDNPYLPENIINNNCVVYTGTHDNSTTYSWWENLDEFIKKKIFEKYNFSKNPSWNLIEIGMQTNSKLFVAPLQDILSLDNSCRLNTPGTIHNNWRWKYNKSLNELSENIIKYGSLGQSYSRGNSYYI